MVRKEIRVDTLDGFVHRSAEVNGVRLHYVIGGRGPAVVLLHGFPETWYAWRGVMPALGEEHTVIVPDLRGVGESSLKESGYDKENLAEDVYRLVRSLGFEEVSVVGHDMGATTAYAREHREEVGHLVLMSAALPGFGLEELMEFSEPGGGRYHLVFFQQPEVPEKLIEGRALEVYDAQTLQSSGRVDAGEGPTHVVAGPDDRFYVADTRGGAILVYEARPEPGRVASAPLPRGSPYGIAMDPERGQLWVTLTAENRLVRFDISGGTPREMDRYPTVRQPNTAAVDPESGRVFVAGAAEGELQILDPR